MSEKNRKSVVKESDYETYWIPIPFGSFLGKQKNKFLYGELEKRHPCFSDDYLFCSKTFLKNRKLESKVFVMDKMKLAEYKLQNPKGQFVSEDKRKIPLFYQSQHGKKFGILILFVILIVMFSFFQTVKNKKNHTLENNSIVETVIELEEEKITLPDNFNFVLNDECECLFEIINSNKSAIKSFFWEYSNFYERFDVSVNSVFPEVVLDSLPESKISNVNYYENKPSFNLTYEKKNVIEGLENENQKENNEIIKNVRNLLLENKCLLMEETVNPCVFRFNLTVNKKDFDSFLKENLFLKLGNFFHKEKTLLKSFSVNCKKNGEDGILLEVAMGVAKNSFKKSVEFILTENKSKNICEFVGRNVKTFFAEMSQDSGKEKKLNYKSSGGKKNNLKKRENLKDSNVLKNKIGEIKNKDGSITIFYKSTDNKILNEIIDE